MKKTSENIPFEDTLSYSFEQFRRAYRSRISDEYTKLGLHVGQEMFITNMSRYKDLTQGKLAELCCVEPPTVTKVLNRMEKAGLVRRSHSKPLTVSLTHHGVRLRKQVESTWLRVEKEMLAGFTTEEQIILRRLMDALRENLEKEHPSART